MKNRTIILLYAVLMSISAYAQKISADKVPSVVMKTFNAKFPNADNAKWEMEHDKDYEVNFQMNNTGHSAVFDANGKWLETESEMKVSDLPAAAAQAIAKQFPGFKIEESEKFENAEHGNCFEVEIEKGEETFDILIKPNGEILSKKAETEKEEEGDKD